MEFLIDIQEEILDMRNSGKKWMSLEKLQCLPAKQHGRTKPVVTSSSAGLHIAKYILPLKS